MSTCRLLSLLLAVLLAASTAPAQVVEPRITMGPDWVQIEEPALRPFKGFWEGTKALGFQSRAALVEGNTKFPLIGSVEVLRGVRRGGIEMFSRTYMSMAGSHPRSYDRVGATNLFIEGDPVLRHAADAATYAGVYSVTGGSSIGGPVLGTMAVQKVVDQAPVNPELRRDVINQRKARRERVQRAQASYIGPRATVNAAEPGRGDLLKPYR